MADGKRRVRIQRTLVMEVTRTYEIDLTPEEIEKAREDDILVDDILDRAGWPESEEVEFEEFEDGAYGVTISLEEI